tara:strand:- start:1736 stop:2569 length:834 start_codon:yes stop_codon:yes gene_type:complete
MQPNVPQDSVPQPGQGQPSPPPVPPTQPPQSVGVPQPSRTIEPLQPVESSRPVIDSAAMQQALDEPMPTPSSPGPVSPVETSPPPVAAVAESQMSEPVDNAAVRESNPVSTETGVDQEDNEEAEPLEQPVAWTAKEYIHQEKGAGWFVAFGIVVVALIGLSVLMQAWSFTALIVVIAFIVIVYLRRPPRELAYSLTDDGLMVDNRLYSYDNFKSFGVVRDGDEYSIMLIPTQRFQPSVTVYFPEEVGEDIVDVLGERMPMKDLKLDAVDRLVRMLRL